MIHVLFEIGGDACALPASRMVRVIPWTELRSLPRSPDYVKGLLNYRGHSVPVIDLAQMLGRPQAAPVLSSRILLVNYPLNDPPSPEPSMLGLLVASAIETIDVQ